MTKSLFMRKNWKNGKKRAIVEFVSHVFSLVSLLLLKLSSASMPERNRECSHILLLMKRGNKNMEQDRLQ
jgi:hypothetical protein